MTYLVVPMAYVNVELSYRTADPELLETLPSEPGTAADEMSKIGKNPGIHEFLLLATCNRFEFFLWAGGDAGAATDAADAAEAVCAAVADHAGRTVEDVAASAAVRERTGAVEHLLAVACGLESMAIGEDQIVGQLRDAFRQARLHGTAGPRLTALVEHALHTSKRVRSDTGIKQVGTSLVHHGIDLARAELDGLRGRCALVHGTGTVGALACKLLGDEGAHPVLVTSRTHETAVRLAERTPGAHAVPGDTLPVALARADVLVSATAARYPQLSAADLEQPRQQAGHRPLFALDLARPHDLDPDCATVPGVRLVGLADIGEHLRGDTDDGVTEQAWRMVEEETGRLAARQGQAAAGPLISALRAHAQAEVAAELHRLHRRLPDAGDQEHAAMSAALNRLVGRFLHRPIMRARRLSGDPEGDLYLDALTRLFEADELEATS